MKGGENHSVLTVCDLIYLTFRNLSLVCFTSTFLYGYAFQLISYDFFNNFTGNKFLYDCDNLQISVV